MIIKSRSRKTASFSQLLTYMNKGRIASDSYFFRHNIYGYKPYYIVKEYRENYRNLKRRINSNALYHEIISLKHQSNLTIKEQREMLQDLLEQYVNARANHNMVYGVIHEQHNQIHCHLMISSNELSNAKNKRLSKKDFAEIKTNLENYARVNYPRLEMAEKTKARAKARVVDNEVQLKKRTGKKSDRELMKERLESIFAKSKKSEDFIKYLETEKIQVYRRGETFGFLDEATGRKYRLKTLELEKEFREMDMDFTQARKISQQKELAKKSFSKLELKEQEKFREQMKEARSKQNAAREQSREYNKQA